MHLAIGCDHRGFALKEAILGYLKELGHTYWDFGCLSPEAVDYPDIAFQVAQGVARGEFQQGILVCSTGIGMCIAANKVKGVRAALAADPFTARRSREHNDANILCLGAEVVNGDKAKEIVSLFLTIPFEGGRHQRRLDKIRAME